MCGIAGWVGNRSSKPTLFDEKLQSIKKVIEFQNHRGPDANGIWEDRANNVILGHNRLSIVELSEAGAQPMEDDSGDWVISYNGELYNHNLIRQELIKKFSIKFRGKAILEVVLYAVKHFGIDEFLRKADGMFALLFLISKMVIFILLETELAKTNFIFFETKKGFCFGSELKKP